MSRTATPRDLVPEAHNVLGTMLRPFSLGHHLLLTRIQSPFSGDDSGDVFSTPDALALAVFVCAAPYSDIQESIIRGDLASDHIAWLKRLRPKWYQPTRFIHEDESEKFSKYLRDGYRRAPVMRHMVGGIELSAPWECHLLARLMSGGYSEIEALEKYLPAAWYHYHTLGEISQSENLTDITKWRKVFWTESDARHFESATRTN